LKLADQWLASLKELNPQHSKLEAFAKEIADTRAWVAAAKQRKEEAARLKREKELAQIAVDNQALLQTWKLPFSGGKIETRHSQWEYSNDGDLKCVNGEHFRGWTAKWGPTKHSRVSLDLKFSGPPSTPSDVPNNFCWLLWKGGAMECDFHSVSISNTSRVHSVIELSAPSPNYFSNLFEIGSTRVEGSVPPPIVAALTGLKLALERVQAQVKKDKLELRKIKWKDARFEKLTRSWMSCCSGCNCSGHNLYFCYDCEGSYCTNSSCKPGSSGVNVCPFCNGYNGSTRPSWASNLKDPRDTYNWERELNDFLLTDNDWPQWARWVENYRF